MIRPDTDAEDGPHYGADLAAIHHAHFGKFASDAAIELLQRLTGCGFDTGLVVDLAAGSGITARRLVDAGFRVVGVDLSAAMLRIARRLVPEATWIQGSLWTTPLPSGIVAVAAVGEAFSYATDPAAGMSGLGERLAAIHRALVPGGVLLFDVAGPGRGGPGGVRERCFRRDGILLVLAEREDAEQGSLSREITTFTPFGRLYRRSDETHRLTLYAPEKVEAMLDEAGFSWERLSRYHETRVTPGWHAFAARKRR